MQSNVSEMALWLKVPAIKCVDFSLIVASSYIVEAENLLLQVPPGLQIYAMVWVSLDTPNYNNFFNIKCAKLKCSENTEGIRSVNPFHFQISKPVSSFDIDRNLFELNKIIRWLFCLQLSRNSQISYSLSLLNLNRSVLSNSSSGGMGSILSKKLCANMLYLCFCIQFDFQSVHCLLPWPWSAADCFSFHCVQLNPLLHSVGAV